MSGLSVPRTAPNSRPTASPQAEERLLHNFPQHGAEMRVTHFATWMKQHSSIAGGALQHMEFVRYLTIGPDVHAQSKRSKATDSMGARIPIYENTLSSLSTLSLSSSHSELASFLLPFWGRASLVQRPPARPSHSQRCFGVHALGAACPHTPE